MNEAIPLLLLSLFFGVFGYSFWKHNVGEDRATAIFLGLSAVYLLYKSIEYL